MTVEFAECPDCGRSVRVIRLTRKVDRSQHPVLISHETPNAKPGSKTPRDCAGSRSPVSD